MTYKRILCCVLSVVLALGMSPATALAATANASQTASASVAPAQIEGTEGVDYAAGEVLVAVRGGAATLEAATATSGVAQLLGASANEAGSSALHIDETLACVSADDVSNASDELDASDNVDLESGAASATLSSAAADDIEIILLTCDDVAQTIADLQQLDCVVAAQPNYYYELSDDEADAQEIESGTVSEAGAASAVASASASATATLASTTTGNAGTTEPFYKAQWSLENAASLVASGYSSKTTNLDVEDAWAQGAGNEEGGDVVVAVIDTGVDYTHEDLQGSMWTGGDAAWSTALGGGTYGINLLKDGSRGDPMDRFGHGTHCASIIAAGWNGTGIAGINNKVKIMAVRAIGAGSSEATSASQILAFNYVITAKQNGVNVVATNNSYGSAMDVGYPDVLYTSLIYKAGEEGIISVCSAGNASYNNDLTPSFERDNANPYLITVGALNSVNDLVGFSQYGVRSTDVFSPGSRVLAATTSYNAKAGTSDGMAAQYVPWLEGSASSKSAYFLDDASSATGKDGITYELVSYKEGFKEVSDFGGPEIAAPGYYNGSTNNGTSYKFNLQNVKLQDDESLAVRMTIPKATWDSYVAQNKGDKLYLAMMGNTTSFGTGMTPYVTAYTNDGTEWKYDYREYLAAYDGTWYNLSSNLSVSALDKGKDANGNVTIYLNVFGLNSGTTFKSGDCVYLDNISLGWACSSDFGTANANGTYYYSDGTSMAAPNTTGTVSLLCSKAQVASGSNATYQQSAETAREIVAFIKGSVTQLDTLSTKCKTGGAVNANTAYSAYAAYENATTAADKLAVTATLKPVPESITDNGDGTFTLKGSFFGSDKGAVTFDGAALTVQSWTDSAITFTSPGLDKETIGKIVVTKANGTSGQSYVVMPAAANASGMFDTLPNPDFEFTFTDATTSGKTTTLTVNANTVTPLKMAAAAGYVYVYGTVADDSIPVLMRYCIATGAWDTKNYLADYADQVHTNNNRLMVSMTAGASQIYLQTRTPIEGNKTASRLFTFDALSGEVVYNVLRDASQPNIYGSLGFYDGKLYMVGGAKDEPVCSAIYPDTGAVYWSSTEKLPRDVYYGIVTNNGSGLTVTGAVKSQMADLGSWQNGLRSQEMDITFGTDGTTTLSIAKSVFYPEAFTPTEYGLDAGQTYSAFGAASVDGGVLMTGPVRENETANMVDTWVYNTTSQKWDAVSTARFAPALESSVCSCTYDGVYYVMAEDLQTEGVWQRFASYPLSKIGLSDEKVAPTSDAAISPKKDDDKGGDHKGGGSGDKDGGGSGSGTASNGTANNSSSSGSAAAKTGDSALVLAFGAIVCVAALACIVSRKRAKRC